MDHVLQGGHGNPLQCSCLENPHGQRSLTGYSPQSHTESDMTRQTCRKSNDSPCFSALPLVRPVDQQALYKTPAELDPQTRGHWRAKHPYPALGSLNSKTRQDSVPKEIESVCCQGCPG